MDLKETIRTIPDYPKPGIMFRDVTTLLGQPRAFRQAIDELVQPYAGLGIDKVAGIEARGFILGGVVATSFQPVSFRCARKASCLTRRSPKAISWNMASMRWKCTRMPSSKATVCFWSMT